MNKNLIKMLAVLVAVLSLWVFESGMAWVADSHADATKDASPAVSGELLCEAAKDHMLAYWTEYLSLQEQRVSAENAVYTRIEAFGKSNDWEDLTKARKACMKAICILEELGQESDMLTGQLDSEAGGLSGEGIDFLPFIDEMKNASGKMKEDYELMQLYLNVLEGESPFLWTHASVLGSTAVNGQFRTEKISNYTCMLTNRLLLSLAQPDTSTAFWNIMPSLFPNMCEMRWDWYDTEEEFSEWIELFSHPSKFPPQEELGLLGILKDSRYDLPANEHINTLTSTPILLPTPAWYDPDKADFMTELEISFAAQSLPLEEMPKASCFMIKEISKSDVEQYVEEASPYAMDVRDTEENMWDLIMDGYMLSIEWKDDTAMLTFRNEDNTFAPKWFLEHISVQS